MDKTKTLKKIRTLSDEILKTGDEESVLAAHALKFVALFLALGYIQLLMAFFGNLGTLIKWTEDKEEAEGPLVMPAMPDIMIPGGSA